MAKISSAKLMISDLDIDVTLLIVLINGNLNELVDNDVNSNSKSDEIRTKLFNRCKSYLSGKWAEVEPKDIDITPVESGHINSLYVCALPQNIQDKNKKVIFRLEDQKTIGLNEFKSRSHELVINAILSEKGIAPKLLAVFDGGSISEMIEGRYFIGSDDKIQERVVMLAQKLALFHSLQMPIPKERSSMFEKMSDPSLSWLKTTRESYKVGIVKQLIQELHCQTLLEMDVFDEVNWINQVIKKLKCPIVFSHNDFNRKNILIQDSNGLTREEVFIIDFDWTNYNDRGVDFGQYFSNWGQTEPEFGSSDFPSDQQMSPFIEAYIIRMTEIFGENYSKQEINCRERLLKESKVFALMAYLKDVIFLLWKTSSGRTDDGDHWFMQKAEIRFKMYKDVKQKILKKYF